MTQEKALIAENAWLSEQVRLHYSYCCLGIIFHIFVIVLVLDFRNPTVRLKILSEISYAVWYPATASIK